MRNAELGKRIREAIEDAHNHGFSGLEAALKQLEMDLHKDIAKAETHLVLREFENAPYFHANSA